MADINLLPWREREQAHRRAWLMWGMAAVSVLAVMVVLSQWLFWQNRLQIQHQRVAYLESERRNLESGPDGLRALASRWARQFADAERERQLRVSAAAIHRLLVLLAEELPDTLYLRGLRAEGPHFTAFGEVYQSGDFNELLEKFKHSALIRGLRVEEIGAIGLQPSPRLSFRLEFEVDYGVVWPVVEGGPDVH